MKLEISKSNIGRYKQSTGRLQDVSQFLGLSWAIFDSNNLELATALRAITHDPSPAFPFALTRLVSASAILARGSTYVAGTRSFGSVLEKNLNIRQ